MELFSQHSLLAWTHVYPAQPEVEEQWLQQSSALLVIIAVLCKFVPSLFLPTMVSHMPGDGDGEGEGEGSAQVGGAGPNLIPCGACTTTLVTANCAPLDSPQPHEPSSGTQPVHCVDAMAAPVLSMFCLICFFSLSEGPPLT